MQVIMRGIYFLTDENSVAAMDVVCVCVVDLYPKNYGS